MFPTPTNPIRTFSTAGRLSDTTPRMSIKLENVVPWGRSMDEYVRLFDLDDAALNSRIVGVGDGPASFNAEMHAAGRRVVSCDPIYVFSGERIRSRVEATHDPMIAA